MRPSEHRRAKTGGLGPLFVALCAAMLSVCGHWPVSADITVEQVGSQVLVRSPFYEATISLDNGGRIVSYVYDGVEMTGLCPDGHGGLMEEVHCADFRFHVRKKESTDHRLTLTLAADAGQLRVRRGSFLCRLESVQFHLANSEGSIVALVELD